jgi:feruloyl esterase
MLPTLIVLAAAAGALAQPPTTPKKASADCGALAAVTLPDTRITSEAAVAATPDGIPVPHCKVLGVIGAEIRFQMLLPDAWNGGFLMGGARRLPDRSTTTSASSRAVTHSRTPIPVIRPRASRPLGMGHPDRLANYGHVAVHRTAETAKAIVRASTTGAQYSISRAARTAAGRPDGGATTRKTSTACWRGAPA